MNTKQRASNTKKKSRIGINLVDIITVIALIAALATAGLGIYNSLSSSGSQVRIRYIVEAEPMDSSLTAKVNTGDGIYESDSARQIGTVRAASSAPAYYTGTGSAGEKVDTPIEGQSVLYITAETTAVKTDTGYAAGSTLIGIGRELELRMPNLYCTGKCISIEIIEQ